MPQKNTKFSKPNFFTKLKFFYIFRMYEIFTRGEQIISNNNIIFTKMKSDDNERLNALEMIRFDLLYESI